MSTPPPAGSDPAPQAGATAELADEDRPESWGEPGPAAATSSTDDALRRDLPPHWRNA